MKKAKGFVIRRIGPESVIVAESLDLIDFDRLVSLNSSAAYVWESLGDKDFDADTIVGVLTGRYDVDAVSARQDALALLDVWRHAGIIED